MQAADWVSNNSIQFNLFKKTRHNADDAGCWVHKMSEYRIDLLSACLRLMCYTWQTEHFEDTNTATEESQSNVLFNLIFSCNYINNGFSHFPHFPHFHNNNMKIVLLIL